MPQYEDEVLERIEAGETAWEILDEALPTARKRFRRLTNSLIRKHAVTMSDKAVEG